jgi:aminopeptidase-like protein
LGKRGLYGSIGGRSDEKTSQLAMLWVLNLSDGQHTLLDIADRSGLEFDLLRETADILVKHDLLQECLEPKEIQARWPSKTKSPL